MIQPNELRIGNWVYDSKYTQYPMQVVLIGSDYVYLDFEGNEGDVWECDCKEIVPIPLTEELIEKQGWYKFDSYYNNGEIKICKNEDWWHLYISDVIHRNIIAVDVKYLHELQNAYFIATKKELEIKL